MYYIKRNIENYLGVKKFKFGEIENKSLVGVCTGLAWTEVGGELLQIESVIMPGKGKAYYTGKLGDVMKESVQAAQSFVHSNAKKYGINVVYLKKMIFMYMFLKALHLKMVHQLV